MADKIEKMNIGFPERKWLADTLEGGYIGHGPGPEDVAALLPSLTLVRYSDGAEIVVEGERGKELFFLYKGGAAVKKAKLLFGKKGVARLKPGDFFGEVSFLVQAPRSATVAAEGKTEVFRLAPGEFQALLEKHPDIASHLEETARRRMQKLSEA